MSSTEPTKDWRYCKCSHKADDHNPVHLGCYKCDCERWTFDMERSRIEQQKLEDADK